MNNNDELWLMVKDSKNKRIKMHIQFNIEDYINQKTNNIYSYINYMMNYVSKIIDDKQFSIIKKGMEYDLAGIEEFRENDEGTYEWQLGYMLYSFERNLAQLIEYISKTLDYEGVDIEKLYPFISGVLEAKKMIIDFPKFPYHTKQQQTFIDVDILNMIKKLNLRIQWQINNIRNQVNCQNWSLPPWFAIANTFNSEKYIERINKYEIKIKEANNIITAQKRKNGT
jgi:hypothetical protein